MNVLLIGKFPPCQGGIAAKTYWLWSAIAERGVQLDAVTLAPDIYRSADVGPLPSGINLATLALEKPPWFLPGSDMVVEQLVTAALELTSTRKPHVVEANYLVPFGAAALIVSKHLGVPLLLRHAGSDMVKLGAWTPARRAISALLSAADVVVSPDDPSSSELLDQAKVLQLPRYIPDPRVFKLAPANIGTHRLLLAGKLNYYWKLKAIDTLLDALVACPGWSLLAVADGIGKQAVQSEVEQRGLSGRVEWRNFVSPSEMPAILAEVSAVWAVERPGGVPDFSNLVIEALAIGRPCLVAPSTATHPDAAWLKESHSLLVIDPDDTMEIVTALDVAATMGETGPLPDHEDRYQAYVDDNARLYEELADLSSADGTIR